MTHPKSKKPKKQRKYITHLKLHEKKRVLSAHLSKELMKELEKRSLSVRKDDKIKVLRGKFKGTLGKIISINSYKERITVENIKRKKADGTEIFVPVKASNVVIVELNRNDVKRVRGKTIKKAVKVEKEAEKKIAEKKEDKK